MTFEVINYINNKTTTCADLYYAINTNLSCLFCDLKPKVYELIHYHLVIVREIIHEK